MRRHLCLVALGVAACFGLLAGGARADEPKKAPGKKTFALDGAPQEAKTKEQKDAARRAQSVGDLALAYQLADYGRANKSPEALIQAAAILSKMKTDSKAQTIKAGKGEDATPVKLVLFRDEAAALLKEARALVKAVADEKLNDPDVSAVGKKEAERIQACLLDWIGRLEKGTRGFIGGPHATVRRIGPGGTEPFVVTFVPGQLAVLLVSGPPGARLNLTVSDLYGERITASRYGQNEQLRFVPLVRGPYYLTVHNANRNVVTYRLAGN